MRIAYIIRRKAIGLLLISIFVSCDPWFSYSPYEADVNANRRNTTEKNLALIQQQNHEDSKPFKVALLADPHYHFSKLEDAIDHINKDPEFVFAIVAGDLTENGLLQEFIYFHDAMSRLRVPYLTVIGNHDYLANGEMVYEEMYGPVNYSFTFNNTRFVLFDNNTIESGKEPDLDWIERELVNDSNYDHVVPVAHVPPYDVQMEKYRDRYHTFLFKNGINLSVHGHRHDFSLEKVFGDDIEYLTISSPQKRTYTALSVSPTSIEVQKIEY